uniref:Putative tail tube protein n=1 Tax=viral metagenome TaxID=1070528 RepID=A0A6M3J9J3_9ZZZZ
MALESQGVVIRRISTVAGTTGTVASTNTLGIVGRELRWSNVAADFGAAGFTTGMRLIITGATNSNTGIYTVMTAAATVLTLYDVVTAQAEGHSLAVSGHRYDPIGGIRGFQGPSGQAGVIDVTTLNSTAKEKLIGLRDEGSLTLDAFLDPQTATAQQIALIADRAGRTLRTFDIKFSDITPIVTTSQPTGVNFDAYVSNFAVTGAVDQAVTVSIGLEITSALKWIPKV